MKGWVDLGRTQVRLSALCEVGKVGELSDYYSHGFRSWYSLTCDVADHSERYSALEFDELCRRIAEAEGEEKPVDTRPEPPSDLLTMTREIFEDMGLTSLFERYAEAYRLGNHSHALFVRRSILQVVNERIDRAFEQGKAAAKPSVIPGDWILENLPTYTIEGCLQQYAIAEQLTKIGSDDEVNRAKQRQAFIIAELERRTKPELKKVKVRSMRFGTGAWDIVLSGTIFRTQVSGNNEIEARKFVAENLAAIGLEAEFEDET